MWVAVLYRLTVGLVKTLAATRDAVYAIWHVLRAAVRRRESGRGLLRVSLGHRTGTDRAGRSHSDGQGFGVVDLETSSSGVRWNRRIVATIVQDSVGAARIAH